VFLVRRDEEGGREGVEAVFFGVFDSLRKASAVAIIDAAVFDIAGDGFTEIVEAVVFDEDAVNADGFNVIFQAVAAGFIFHIRMDVRIKPENGRFDSLFSQRVDAVNRAGGATSMHEKLFRHMVIR